MTSKLPAHFWSLLLHIHSSLQQILKFSLSARYSTRRSEYHGEQAETTAALSTATQKMLRTSQTPLPFSAVTLFQSVLFFNSNLYFLSYSNTSVNHLFWLDPVSFYHATHIKFPTHGTYSPDLMDMLYIL